MNSEVTLPVENYESIKSETVIESKISSFTDIKDELKKPIDKEEKMFVIKRDGTKQEMLFDEITKRNRKLVEKLKINIDEIKLSQYIIPSLISEMKTSEIDEISSSYAYYLSEKNPEYDKLAAHIVVDNLHKQTSPTFRGCIEELRNNVNLKTKTKQPLLSKLTYDFAIENIES